MDTKLGLDYNGIAAMKRREISYLKKYPAYADGIEIESRRLAHRDCLWLSRRLAKSPDMSALSRFIARTS